MNYRKISLQNAVCKVFIKCCYLQTLKLYANEYINKYKCGLKKEKFTFDQLSKNGRIKDKKLSTNKRCGRYWLTLKKN